MIRLFHFYPIPFLFSLLILAVLIWFNRKRGLLYLGALVMFWGYCLVVINIMYFPLPIPEDWPANLSRAGILESLKQVNLIPFNYHIGGGIRADIRSGFSDVVINVLMTVPIGMGICYLFRPRWYLVLFVAAPVIGLVFEAGQMFFKVVLGVYFHAVDASDVVTNTAGVLIGAVIFALIHFVTRKIAAWSRA